MIVDPPVLNQVLMDPCTVNGVEVSWKEVQNGLLLLPNSKLTPTEPGLINIRLVNRQQAALGRITLIDKVELSFGNVTFRPNKQLLLGVTLNSGTIDFSSDGLATGADVDLTHCDVSTTGTRFRLTESADHITTITVFEGKVTIVSKTDPNQRREVGPGQTVVYWEERGVPSWDPP